MRHVKFIFLSMLLCEPAFCTSWTWSLSGSDLPGATGTFSACEATTHTKLTGNYLRASSGFIHMSSPVCNNGCNSGCGSCTNTSVTSGSCASLPANIYGMEVPNVHFIVQPILNNGAAVETQPIYNIVQTGSCPTGTSTMDFVFSQWISGFDDTSRDQQTVAGTFTWNASTNAATVTGRYNITDLHGMNANYGYSNTGCSSGVISTTGAAGTDQHGTIYISNNSEFFYQTDTGHAIFGVPQKVLNSASELRGTYSGFGFDASGTNTVLPFVNMYFDPATTSMTGFKMLTDSTWDTSTLRKLSLSDLNIPVNGMLHGTLSDGTNTGSFVCVAELALNNYNSLFCSGQKPGSLATPYTILLSSAVTYDLTALRGNWDAQYTSQSGSSWNDDSNNQYACTMNSGVTWTGSGSASSPYAMSFSSTNSGADFGSSVLGSQTHVMFDTWVAPSAATSGDEVILGNSSDGTGKGFTLRQSKTKSGNLELVIGKSYQDIVLADGPYIYWRLNEASGSTAKDISGNGTDGAYTSVTQGSTSLLAGDTSSSGLFNGSTSRVTLSTLTPPTTFSFEAWVKPTNNTSSNSLFRAGNDAVYAWASGQFNLNGDGGQQVQLGSFSGGTTYHVVATSDGTNVTLYINGAAQTPVFMPWNNGGPLIVGGDSFSQNLTGNLQEVAFYNYILTSSQVTTHYNAGLGSYGGICYSSNTFSNGLWNFLGGLYDGTNATLFVNGRQDCQVAAPSTYFSAAATDLVAGSTASGTHPWQGQMADLKVYGTSDGSSVGSATNLKSNFDASADRFRAIPLGNIVTNGLVLNLDPANAVQGLRFPGVGCAMTNWFDISPSALTAVLTGFTSCGTYGWQGNGTTTPYQVVMDGSNSYASVAANANLNVAGPFTMTAWINPQGTPGQAGQPILEFGSTLGVLGVHFWQWNNFDQLYANVIDTSGATHNLGSSSSQFTAGNWYYVALTYDGSVAAIWSGDTQLAYINLVGIIPQMSYNLNIGYRVGGSYAYNGSMGGVTVYSRGLSQAELSQNCKAQMSRYPGSVCN